MAYRALVTVVVAGGLMAACGSRESALRRLFADRQNEFAALVAMLEADRESRVIELARVERWDGRGVPSPDHAEPGSLDRLGMPSMNTSKPANGEQLKTGQ